MPTYDLVLRAITMVCGAAIFIIGVFKHSAPAMVVGALAMIAAGSYNSPANPS